MLSSRMSAILLDRSHQSSLMHCSDSPGSTIARYIVRLKLQKAAYVVEGSGKRVRNSERAEAKENNDPLAARATRNEK